MTKRRSSRKKDEGFKFRSVEAKTNNQKDYIISISENDVVFCTGPSGSGKSYIAAGIASEHLFYNKINRVVIARPLVATGKEIGHLPGEIMDKIAPYLMPMQEHFRHFLGKYYGEYVNDVPPRIEYRPVEMMRGSTFDNTYMILDEAQNCTFEQIKMFVTRIGKGSKVLVNGDVKQTDLSARSGLNRFIELVDGIEGVGVTRMSNRDIQRHDIIGRILRAVESEE